MRRIVGRIASVAGRYYAMDRDKRWERIERAKGAMVNGSGEKSTDAVAAVKRSYERGVTDEFIEPVTIVDVRREPVGLIRGADACTFFNFRADRGRQMTKALIEAPLTLHFTTLTQDEERRPLRSGGALAGHRADDAGVDGRGAAARDDGPGVENSRR